MNVCKLCKQLAPMETTEAHKRRHVVVGVVDDDVDCTDNADDDDYGNKSRKRMDNTIKHQTSPSRISNCLFALCLASFTLALVATQYASCLQQQQQQQLATAPPTRIKTEDQSHQAKQYNYNQEPLEFESESLKSQQQSIAPSGATPIATKLANNDNDSNNNNNIKRHNPEFGLLLGPSSSLPFENTGEPQSRGRRGGGDDNIEDPSTSHREPKWLDACNRRAATHNDSLINVVIGPQTYHPGHVIDEDRLQRGRFFKSVSANNQQEQAAVAAARQSATTTQQPPTSQAARKKRSIGVGSSRPLAYRRLASAEKQEATASWAVNNNHHHASNSLDEKTTIHYKHPKAHSVKKTSFTFGVGNGARVLGGHSKSKSKGRYFHSLPNTGGGGGANDSPVTPPSISSGSGSNSAPAADGSSSGLTTIADASTATTTTATPAPSPTTTTTATTPTTLQATTTATVTEQATTALTTEQTTTTIKPLQLSPELEQVLDKLYSNDIRISWHLNSALNRVHSVRRSVAYVNQLIAEEIKHLSGNNDSDSDNGDNDNDSGSSTDRKSSDNNGGLTSLWSWSSPSVANGGGNSSSSSAPPSTAAAGEELRSWLPKFETLLKANPTGESRESRRLLTNVTHYIQFFSVAVEQIIYDYHKRRLEGGETLQHSFKNLETSTLRLLCNAEDVVKMLDALQENRQELVNLLRAANSNAPPPHADPHDTLAKLNLNAVDSMEKRVRTATDSIESPWYWYQDQRRLAGSLANTNASNNKIPQPAKTVAQGSAAGGGVRIDRRVWPTSQRQIGSQLARSLRNQSILDDFSKLLAYYQSFLTGIYV